MLSDSLPLLASLSGIADDDTAKEVAETLDYQPLALASAARLCDLCEKAIHRSLAGKTTYGSFPRASVPKLRPFLPTAIQAIQTP